MRWDVGRPLRVRSVRRDLKEGEVIDGSPKDSVWTIYVT
jgi:hypothetical protein